MGKKRPNTIRTTISVPRELKGRMDKVKEDVNWSALACQAFQAKLAEIATRKETRKMTDVIERLRASKRKSDSEDFQDGFLAGTEWAEKRAEAAELERLEALHKRLSKDPSYDWNAFFGEWGSSAYSVAEQLFFELQPHCDGDRNSASEFWLCAFDNEGEGEELRPELIKGFAEGALKVWNIVQDSL